MLLRFLDASSHLYMRVYPSLGRLVRPLVGQLVSPMPKMISSLYENHRGTLTSRLLNVLGVLGVLNVLKGLNVLCLICPWTYHLAYWA